MVLKQALQLLCLFFSVISQVKAESPTSESAKSSDEYEAQLLTPSPVKPSKLARSNVAVITVYDKELADETSHQHKRHKKSSAKKKKSSLAVQVRSLVMFTAVF